ncbi:MAG: acyltransferase [Chloroflexi bacterium]|nr:acyltransferase [Chloroflexota bacterium]
MARPFSIALGQMVAEETRKASISKAVDFVGRAAGQGADLIIFPEIGMCQFFPQFRADYRWFDDAEPIPGGDTCESMQEAAAKHHIAVVVSIYEVAIEGVYYDSAAVIDRDGKLLGTQRMMHIAEEPLYNEKFYYKPGNTCEYPSFLVGGNVRVGVAICQDAFFPEQIRLLTLHGAELIVVPTAVSCETDPILLASQSGAVLNQVFFATANRAGTEGGLTFTGQSHVADPTGKIVALSEEKGDHVLVVPVDIDLVRDVRRRQNYWLRDRRPETYGDLTKLLF